MAGRYLQPEPLLGMPESTAAYAYRGITLPTYSYAANNPILFVDPTGLNPSWSDFLIFVFCLRNPTICESLFPPPPGGGGGGDKVCKMPKKGDGGPYRCATKCQAHTPKNGAVYVMAGSEKSCSEATKQAKALAFAAGGTSVHHCRCADTKGFLGTGHQCE